MSIIHKDNDFTVDATLYPPGFGVICYEVGFVFRAQEVHAPKQPPIFGLRRLEEVGEMALLLEVSTHNYDSDSDYRNAQGQMLGCWSSCQSRRSHIRLERGSLR
jgi:hypothetical protein